MSKNKKEPKNIIQEDSYLSEYEETLKQKEAYLINLEKQIKKTKTLNFIIALAFFFFYFSTLLFHIIYIKTINTPQSNIESVNTQNKYDDFVYSLFDVDNYTSTFVDENNNTFFLDPECTKGNEINNPIFISRNSFRIKNSIGDKIDVYLLEDDTLVYIPSNKNVNLSW